MTLTIDEEVSIGRLIEEKIRQHFDNHLNHWHTKYFGQSPPFPYVKECSAINENSNLVHIPKDELHRLQEKAKKVDDWQDKGQYILIRTDEYNEALKWKEKAKNCDTEKSLKEFFQEKSERLENKLVTAFNELETKEKESDSLERHWDENGRCPNYDRAQKWDQVAKLVSEDEYFGLKKAKE